MSPEAVERRKAYQREYQRLRRLDPTVQAQERIRKSDPVYRAERCAYVKQRYAHDLAFRERCLERGRRRRQDPIYRERKALYMRDWWRRTRQAKMNPKGR